MATLAIQNRAPHDTKFRDENLPGWFGYMRVVWGGQRMRPVWETRWEMNSDQSRMPFCEVWTYSVKTRICGRF